MRYHEAIFLTFLKLALLGALSALIRAYKGPNFKIMHFSMGSCDLLTIALLMRYHEPIFLKFLKLALLGALFVLIRTYKCPNSKTMHFKMESCDLLTIALLMRYHEPTFTKVLKLAHLGALSALEGFIWALKCRFSKYEKTSPDIVAVYHKNPKVKVSDILTGFCCAPKFCDRHTDRQTHIVSF